MRLARTLLADGSNYDARFTPETNLARIEGRVRPDVEDIGAGTEVDFDGNRLDRPLGLAGSPSTLVTITGFVILLTTAQGDLSNATNLVTRLQMEGLGPHLAVVESTYLRLRLAEAEGLTAHARAVSIRQARRAR